MEHRNPIATGNFLTCTLVSNFNILRTLSIHSGKDRNMNIIEVACSSCGKFFHESCIGYQMGKLLAFSMNYFFQCKFCSHTGVESYRRASVIRIYELPTLMSHSHTDSGDFTPNGHHNNSKSPAENRERRKSSHSLQQGQRDHSLHGSLLGVHHDSRKKANDWMVLDNLQDSPVSPEHIYVARRHRG